MLVVSHQPGPVSQHQASSPTAFSTLPPECLADISHTTSRATPVPLLTWQHPPSRLTQLHSQCSDHMPGFILPPLFHTYLQNISNLLGRLISMASGVVWYITQGAYSWERILSSLTSGLENRGAIISRLFVQQSVGRQRLVLPEQRADVFKGQ